ncbi:mitochondrial dicarboxylate carrier isoform X2 [Peromyscus maniculatus bairdii]|uniref:mitochondrial dicarboxylate carrier isoform X2 n=1 Tax=Peromyscus maniculatus bairdii TaxID=230844 RepID=UPI001C2ED41F|nr:mitochondrial dicarboxylate carrier isoform X1 [Peromyscus maniculatus bairdii]
MPQTFANWLKVVGRVAGAQVLKPKDPAWLHNTSVSWCGMAPPTVGGEMGQWARWWCDLGHLLWATSAGMVAGLGSAHHQVHLQTQQEVKLRMTGMALQVVRTDGILALYNGLSASLCRQMTYSLTRFAIYETMRDYMTKDHQGPLPFYNKVLLGGISGLTGGFVGTPADLVNVRMQNDMKLPLSQRRNYSHALDGLYRVAREEGLKKLFSGATMASSRGALVTVGQLSCYDQAKQLVLSTGYLSDNIFTHFVSSFIAGGCATFLCQPLDVLKTRLMNSKGEYQGVFHCAMETAKLGPQAFFKGLFPAGIRLVPHTVLTFMFLEQLRKHFGIKVPT